MKKLLSLLTVLLPLTLFAQSYLLDNTYGKVLNRSITKYTLGIPKDTFAVPVQYQDQPHVASIDNRLYLFNTTEKYWRPYNSGSGSSGGVLDSIKTLFVIDTSQFYLTTNIDSIDTLHRKPIPDMATMTWVTQNFLQDVPNTNYFETDLTQSSRRVHDANGYSEFRVNGDTLEWNYNRYRFNGIVAGSADSIYGKDAEGNMVLIPVPVIPEGSTQVNSDWDATEGVAVILNKPTKLSDFTNDLVLSSGGRTYYNGYGLLKPNDSTFRADTNYTNGLVTQWRLHNIDAELNVSANINFGGGVTIKNNFDGDSARAVLLLRNNIGTFGGLEVGSTTFYRNSIQNTTALFSQVGISIISDANTTLSKVHPIRVYPGGTDVTYSEFAVNGDLIIPGDVYARGVKLGAGTSGAITTETDPVAVAKTITINGSTQTIGSNPSFSISTTESDPIASAKTLTINGVTQTIGSNPVFTVSTYTGLPVNTYTTSRTLTLADANTWVYINSSTATTVTIPANVFPLNTEIIVVQQGAGQVTIAAGSGVTLQTESGATKLRTTFSSITLKQYSTNVWTGSGSLTL